MTETRYDMIGDWPSPFILVRLLQVVGSPWEPQDIGFVHRETGEACKVGFSPRADPGLVNAMRDGICPVTPSLSEELLEQADAHKSVAVVWVESPPSIPAGRTLVRAVAGIIDSGALAVRSRASGLAHSADAFQAIASRLEDPETESEALIEALVYRRLSPNAETVGMSALGLPDIALTRDVGPDRAADVLTRAATALIRGEPLEGLRAGGQCWSVAATPQAPGARLHLV